MAALSHDISTMTFKLKEETDRYVAVELTANEGECQIGTGTGVPIGVTHQYGIVGEAVPVVTGGVYPVYASVAITVGQNVKIVAGGKVAVATASDKVLGVALSNAKANTLVEVKIG